MYLYIPTYMYIAVWDIDSVDRYLILEIMQHGPEGTCGYWTIVYFLSHSLPESHIPLWIKVMQV